MYGADRHGGIKRGLCCWYKEGLYGAGIKRGLWCWYKEGLYGSGVKRGLWCWYKEGLYGADQNCGTKKGSVVQRGCSANVVPKR